MEDYYGFQEFLPHLGTGERKSTYPHTGLLLIKEGTHYEFQEDLQWITFLHKLDFSGSRMASAAGFIVRTRGSPIDVMKDAIDEKTDETPDWADRTITFSVGTFHLDAEVELTVSAIRPDLLLFFLHRVQRGFL